MTKKNIPVGRPSVLRHANAQKLLRHLRGRTSCSRADLVRMSGLSAPTVTNVIKDLIDAGLVEALGERGRSGGRPPDMLRFRAGRGLICAIEITSSALLFLLTDLDGTELATAHVDLAGQQTNPEAICELIATTLKELLRKQNRRRSDLLVTVVGIPAITNVNDGTVLAISTLDNWRSVPLRHLLKRRLPGLIIIENDVNLAALGERFKGAARDVDDFVLISIDAGLGAGIVLGGDIYHGSRWSAGEIGYLRLPGASKSYPKIDEFGELETLFTNAGILKSWKNKQASRKTSRNSPASGVDVLDLAKAGDSTAEQIVRDLAATVADVLLNTSLILNPALTVLTGRVGQHAYLLEAVRARLQQSEFGIERVESGILGDTATRWGAIAVGLNAVTDVVLPSPEASAVLT